MGRNEDDICKAFRNWRPMENRLWGRPGKMWMDIVEEDLDRIRVNEWRERSSSGSSKWIEIVMAAQIFSVY